jgi:hypothetical protein
VILDVIVEKQASLVISLFVPGLLCFLRIIPANALLTVLDNKEFEA